MLRVILLLLAAASLCAQTPPSARPAQATIQYSEKAPPQVDAALRARIARFYDYEIAGKFNQALQLVAADTKDLFVGSSKPTYRSFQILTIRYYDHFTKAEVMSLVNRLMPIEGFMGHPLATKLPTRWKLERGLWCYFVDANKDLAISPFARPGMPPGMGVPPVGAPAAPAVPGALQPPPLPKNLASPRSLVANKSAVELPASGPATAYVAISNPSPWTVGLTVADPKVPGLTVKLDRLTVKSGEKALLSIESAGAVQIPGAPLTVVVTVPDARQTIPVKVTFTK